MDRLDSMPVSCGADEHCTDVLALQNVTVVSIGNDSGVSCFHRHGKPSNVFSTLLVGFSMRLLSRNEYNQKVGKSAHFERKDESILMKAGSAKSWP